MPSNGERPGINPLNQQVFESLRSSQRFGQNSQGFRMPSAVPNSETFNEASVQEEFEMATVADHWGHQFPNETNTLHPLIVGTNRVGVEVELENIRTSYPASRFWRTESDGSLRNNGCEFVFRGPLGGRDLFLALVELDSHLFEADPDASWRCSTHVHLDVRDMTVPQLKNLIIAYVVYERILFRCSGWQRLKNNFCPALCFAQQMLEVLADAWNKRDNRFLDLVRGSWDKYSAMNLVPMGSYGSVEFRMAEGKWRKGHLIKHCNRILSLKEIAMEWSGSPEELIIHLVNSNPSTILKKGLPKEISESEEVANDLEIGAKLAFDIINLANLKTKSAAIRRAQLESAPDESPRFRTRNRTNADVMHLINSSSQVSEVHWWDTGATEIRSVMTYNQLSELMYHCGASRSWLLPSGHDEAFQEYYTQWLRDRGF